MKVIHEINIEASSSTVWQTTIDVESWPKWNPNVELATREDQGQFSVGSSAMITQKGLPPTLWTVSEMTEPSSFSWESTVYGMKMKATHLLESRGSHVNNQLVIEAKGLLVYLFWPLLKISFHKSLEAENTGLKKFIEKA